MKTTIGHSRKNFWFGNGRILGLQLGSFQARCRDPFTEDFALVRRYIRGICRFKFDKSDWRCLKEALIDRINTGSAHPDLLACLGHGAVHQFIQGQYIQVWSDETDLPSLLMAVAAGARTGAALPYLMRALEVHLKMRFMPEGEARQGGSPEMRLFDPVTDLYPSCLDRSIVLDERSVYTLAYIFKLRRPLLALLWKKVRALAKGAAKGDEWRERIEALRALDSTPPVGDTALTRYYVKALHHYNRHSGRPPLSEARRIRRRLVSRLRTGRLAPDVIPLLNELTRETIVSDAWDTGDRDFPDAVGLYRELVQSADRKASLPYLEQALDNAIYILKYPHIREDPYRVEGTEQESQGVEPDQCGHLNEIFHTYECRVKTEYHHARLPLLELVREKLEEWERDADQESGRTLREMIKRVEREERNKGVHVRDVRWKERVGTHFEGDCGYW